MPRRGWIVIIRGPIGAGKTTLLRGLARAARYRFWALDTDAAESYHPSDPAGEHLDDEWPAEIEILALHAKIVLGRGRNLVLDPGLLLTSRNVDRFLQLAGRSRRDPRVVLLRLTVSPEEALRRKKELRPSYIRASHRGWQPTGVAGETVIDTEGLSPLGVLRAAHRALRAHVRARGHLPILRRIRAR
jgi:AAA domain